ncbi:hypothetical protein PENTCL1PPCAC_2171, partial [Pristionchus entomophagus]
LLFSFFPSRGTSSNRNGLQEEVLTLFLFLSFLLTERVKKESVSLALSGAISLRSLQSEGPPLLSILRSFHGGGNALGLSLYKLHFSFSLPTRGKRWMEERLPLILLFFSPLPLSLMRLRKENIRFRKLKMGRIINL